MYVLNAKDMSAVSGGAGPIVNFVVNGQLNPVRTAIKGYLETSIRGRAILNYVNDLREASTIKPVTYLVNIVKQV